MIKNRDDQFPLKKKSNNNGTPRRGIIDNTRNQVLVVAIINCLLAFQLIIYFVKKSTQGKYSRCDFATARQHVVRSLSIFVLHDRCSSAVVAYSAYSYTAMNVSNAYTLHSGVIVL